MPIFGMTDRGLDFPIIGKIKKGILKGKQPIDLDYFRVIIDRTETESQGIFNHFYGEHPREINIFLPFNEIDRVWDAWLKCFTSSMQIAVSDGKHMQYFFDREKGKATIKNGVHVDTGEKVPHMEDLGLTKSGKPLEWKASGTLKVIVPELRRAAYLVLYTTSVWDILHLTEQLKAIDYFTNGKLAGTKLLLKRRPGMVSCPKGKNAADRFLQEKWLCHVEIHPEYVDANIRAYQQLASPTLELPPQLESGIILEGDDDEEQPSPEDFTTESDSGPPNFDDDEQSAVVEELQEMGGVVVDIEPLLEDREGVVRVTVEELQEMGEETEDEEGEEQEPDYENMERPYPPHVVKKLIAKTANVVYARFIGKELTAAQKGLMRMSLNMLFTGQDNKIVQDKRQIVLNELVGVTSTTDKVIDLSIFKAIVEAWIKVKRSSPNDPYYIDDKYCEQEAEEIVQAALVGEGQQTFDLD